MIPQSVLVKIATLGLSQEQAEIVASMLTEVEAATLSATPIDEAAERRRAKDRERKAEKRLRNSADICGVPQTSAEDAEPSSSPEEKTPIPPKTHTSPPKEKTPKGVQKKGCELAEDWKLENQWRQEAEKLGMFGEEIDHEAGKFKDYWRSKPGAGRLKTDWLATWRNWCRSSVERRGNRGPPRQASTSNVSTFFNAAMSLTNENRHLDQSNQHGTSASFGGFLSHVEPPDSSAGTSPAPAPLLDLTPESPGRWSE